MCIIIVNNYNKSIKYCYNNIPLVTKFVIGCIQHDGCSNYLHCLQLNWLRRLN